MRIRIRSQLFDWFIHLFVQNFNYIICTKLQLFYLYTSWLLRTIQTRPVCAVWFVGENVQFMFGIVLKISGGGGT